jgi:hypothetical protein
MGLLNDVSRCTTTRKDGEPCGKPSGPGMPFPICPAHAIEIWKHMDKLVGGTSLAEAG